MPPSSMRFKISATTSKDPLDASTASSRRSILVARRLLEGEGEGEVVCSGSVDSVGASLASEVDSKPSSTEPELG